MCNVCDAVDTAFLSCFVKILESGISLNPPNLILAVTFLVAIGRSCTCRAIMVGDMKNFGGTEGADHVGSWGYSFCHGSVEVRNVRQAVLRQVTPHMFLRWRKKNPNPVL